ncbi:hypothetical protein IJ380_00355 [Candidatus Saccharibacteria bacterium]|nr:hypothetical protein [Candidatus Saccharibacteria bacterium]
MSETLKKSPESELSTNPSEKWESLATVQFKEKSEPEEPKPKTLEHLTVLKTEKSLPPISELSPKDAAEEYLSLLDELSDDFTYPFYKDGSKTGVHQHIASGIARDLGKKYSENPHYRWSGYIGSEADSDDRTLVRMQSADNILMNEIHWRDEGEKAGKKLARLDKDITDLDEEYSRKGRLAKFFYKRKYNQERTKLERSKRAEKSKFGAYNANIAKELAISYNERGDYDFNGGSYGKSENEARNRKFFGFDDPKRAAKIERAIELRRKIEEEKLVK